MFRVDYAEREGPPLGYTVVQNSQEFGDRLTAERFYNEKLQEDHVMWVELFDLTPRSLKRSQKKTKVY